MIPIHPVTQDALCTPEWMHLNHLLSYCTRTLAAGGRSSPDTDDGTDSKRCNRKDCLFSATRR
ncbi:hypothetical protein [Noviherbaspirillum sp. ST9]|uniref:hypothetical protein n=1 Tax=Noviherbaspirillum sp. ST9 TaxID=3401606 RepID=UPI003B58A9A4